MVGRLIDRKPVTITVLTSLVASLLMGALVLTAPQSAEASTHWHDWRGYISQNDTYETSGGSTGDRTVTYVATDEQISEGTVGAEVTYEDIQYAPGNCPISGGYDLTANGESTGEIRLTYSGGEWRIRGVSYQDGITNTTIIRRGCETGGSTQTSTATCCIHLDTPFVHHSIPTGVTDPDAPIISGTYRVELSGSSVYNWVFRFDRGDPENRPPVAVADFVRLPQPSFVPKSHIIDVLANDYDPDGDDIWVTEAWSPYGTVGINGDGHLVYRALVRSCFETIHVIHYTITDGQAFDSASVTITYPLLTEGCNPNRGGRR